MSAADAGWESDQEIAGATVSSGGPAVGLSDEFSGGGGATAYLPTEGNTPSTVNGVLYPFVAAASYDGSDSSASSPEAGTITSGRFTAVSPSGGFTQLTLGAGTSVPFTQVSVSMLVKPATPGVFLVPGEWYPLAQLMMCDDDWCGNFTVDVWQWDPDGALYAKCGSSEVVSAAFTPVFDADGCYRVTVTWSAGAATIAIGGVVLVVDTSASEPSMFPNYTEISLRFPNARYDYVESAALEFDGAAPASRFWTNFVLSREEP